MLNFFRRRDTTARLVLGGFLVLICVAMVMFLIPQGMSGDSSLPVYAQTVATVNGTKITGQDLTSKIQQFGQGQQIPSQLMPMIGQQALRNLVITQALTNQAEKLGLQPTNSEIAQTARQQLPELYPNGKYVGDAQAAQMLATMQLTLPQLQAELRQGLMVSKVEDLITDPVRVSPAEVHRQFELQDQTATFQYVVLDPAQLQSTIQPTPKLLAAYYQQHLSTYFAPEKRQIEVVLANTAAIGAGIHITPAAVDQYYKENIADYTHPEEVQVSHILIKFPDTNPSAAEIAATRTRAESVLKQVQAKPKTFAALAKKYSQDEASASNGGELGFIQRNQTVANFEKVAFSLPVGQISGLVQTEYGFHIIKVEAHNQAYVQPEASVHDQIVSILQKDQAADQAQNLINRVSSLAQNTPLAAVAKQLNLEYFTTAPISQTDPVTGIGVNPNFAGAVFSTQAGALTAPIQVAEGFVVAKVNKIIPPGPQPLAAVQAQVTADYQQSAAQTLAAAQAKALQAAAQKQGLKAAAAKMHLKLQTSPALARSASLPGVGAIAGFADTLFALKPGAVGPVAPVSGKQVVYALTSVSQPTEVDFAQQKSAVEAKLLTQKRNDVLQTYTDALVAQLTKAGKISINEAAFERVLGIGGNTPNSPAPAQNTPRGLGLG
ncbi:MAG: peptidylprolyl isomerase [Terriglobales bacterium]